MSIEKQLLVKAGQKIAEVHLDDQVGQFMLAFQLYERNKNIIVFDWTATEWIASEEILYFLATFKYLDKKNVNFRVDFFKSIDTVTERKAKLLIELWERWKIMSFVSIEKVPICFQLNIGSIRLLKDKFRITTTDNIVYERHNITPAIILDKLERYEDDKVNKIIDAIYDLNDATQEIVERHNCQIPFTSKTIGFIITKEAYENFLDHFKKSFFNTTDNYAFLSITLRKRLNQNREVNQDTQRLLKLNFDTEQHSFSRSFFYDKNSDKYKNRALLEFSFIDFGEGIPGTLRNTFLADSGSQSVSDEQLIDYAFRPNTSRHKLPDRYLNSQSIPRGLFDILTIVKRFEGLMIVRSNSGRVIYDFSTDTALADATFLENTGSVFFSGTLITIYLPERSSDRNFLKTAIKPIIKTDGILNKTSSSIVISLFDLQKKVKRDNVSKEQLYSRVFDLLMEQVSKTTTPRTIYVDFRGYEIDTRITKKIIFYLISDYSINEHNNVIIINPPDIEYMLNIQKEIITWTSINQKYHIHPTPFIYTDLTKEKLSVLWLGIYSESDLSKLNDLLLDENDLRKSDFEHPEDLIGNVNYYDLNGNLKSVINSNAILLRLTHNIFEIDFESIKQQISKYIEKEPGYIYLCPGNYYQYEYIKFTDAFTDLNLLNYLSKALFSKLIALKGGIEECTFLCISTNARRICSYIDRNNLAPSNKIISYDNYNDFVNNYHESIKNSTIVLVCDILSTGYLTEKIQSRIELTSSTLDTVLVIFDAIDEKYEKTKNYANSLETKILSLFKYPIRKFNRDEIKNKVGSGEIKIRRVDPYTNVPIRIQSKVNTNVLMSNHEFISYIKEEHVKAGYFKFNNLVHPYFFDMDKIIEDKNVCRKLIDKIFSSIDQRIINQVDVILYPKESGIKNMDFDYLNNSIFKNQRIKVIELQRFLTNEGWKFPQAITYINETTSFRTALILDDGSCSGESIIQMISEVTMLKINAILLISLIGRVNEHKKDFFSKISSIQIQDKTVPVKIYFGSHWHVPTYYLEESPIIKEKNWLEEMKKIKNIPKELKSVAENISREIEIRKTVEKNNKYLIQRRDNKSLVKELILEKERIGLLSSYRYYTGYFNHIDNLLLLLDKRERSKDRYRKIELISAVFLHEPELFDKVKDVTPDLCQVVSNFAHTILLGNPSKEGNPKLKIADLTFQWEIKNVLHLFFICFKNEELINVLSSTKLLMIINNFCETRSDVNYLFYRILKYFGLNKDDVRDSRVTGYLKSMLTEIGNSDKLNQKHLKQTKTFISFIYTLPFNAKSFTDFLQTVSFNYLKLDDDKFHNEYVYNDKQIITTQLRLIEKKKKSNQEIELEKTTIKAAWKSIANFIELLISFCRTFPEFFLPESQNMYFELDDSEGSLSQILSKLNEELVDGTFSNIDEIVTLLNHLFEFYILQNSKYYGLFKNTYSRDLTKIISEFIDSPEVQQMKISKADGFPSNPILVEFPELYMKEIIFKELRNNLRHAEENEFVEIDLKVSGGNVLMSLVSVPRKNDSMGGGKGLRKLQSINSYPIRCKFEYSFNNNKFFQYFTFKGRYNEL